MTAYMKFSDSLEEHDRGKTLAGLATLAAPHPSIPRAETPQKETPTAAKVAKVAKVEITRSDSTPQEGPSTPAKVAKSAKVTTEPYARVHAALRDRCPAHVPDDRWRLAVDDGRRFLADWGEQAEALGWTPRDLFGVHEVPTDPHPSYQRLARYDCTGLIWLLKGCPVVALTETTAAIRMPTGAILTYRKHNKPAYGPLGDSIDDFVA